MSRFFSHCAAGDLRNDNDNNHECKYRLMHTMPIFWIPLMLIFLLFLFFVVCVQTPLILTIICCKHLRLSLRKIWTKCKIQMYLCDVHLRHIFSLTHSLYVFYHILDPHNRIHIRFRCHFSGRQKPTQTTQSNKDTQCTNTKTRTRKRWRKKRHGVNVEDFKYPWTMKLFGCFTLIAHAK